MTESVQGFGAADGDIDGYEGDELPMEVSEDTILSDLKEEFSADTPENIKWYIVPERPDIALAFNIVMDYDTVKQYFKTATTRKGNKETLDQLKLADIVLSQHTRGIKSKGRLVTVDGKNVTLISKEWAETVNLRGDSHIREVLTRTMRTQGHVISMSQKVIADAGYGDIDIQEGDGPLGLS